MAIRQGLIEYYRVIDEFGANPDLNDLTETQLVTAGEASRVILDEIGFLRDKGWIAVGYRSFHDVVVGAPTSPAVGQRTAEVTYCSDRSGIRVLDAQTHEDTGERPHPYVAGVATVEEGADEIWRLAHIRDEVVETC